MFVKSAVMVCHLLEGNLFKVGSLRGARVTFVPGTTFLHRKRGLSYSG